jgi:arginase
MGAGPQHLLDHGAAELLTSRDASVDVVVVEPTAAWRAEIGTAFDLARTVATHVHAAVAAGRFPVVLSGNCSASLGTTAGLMNGDGTSGDVGVIWLDAHADLNTPETTTTGFLDGMALAALTGRCWQGMTATIPGFQPVDESRVLLVGARDLDPAERALIDDSTMVWASAERLHEHGLTHALLPGFSALRAAGVRRVYLHVDVDVHDPELAPANGFRAPDGLSPDDVQAIVMLVGELFEIAAVGLSAYDPAYDPDGVTRDVALRLVDAVTGRATR